MTTLFVTMQDPASRRWAPVARLTRENGHWRFGYTAGARMLPGFAPFGRLKDLDAVYVSEELFPLFANRVLPKSRPEYASYLGWLGLTEADPLEELSRAGGLRATDGLELIGCPEPSPDQYYRVQFFARGLRQLPEPYRAAIDRLAPGDHLYLLRNLQNPAMGWH